MECGKFIFFNQFSTKFTQNYYQHNVRFCGILSKSQRSKYPETPLNSTRRAEIWLPRGCPGGAKNTTHTLAGEAAPVYDHARD